MTARHGDAGGVQARLAGRMLFTSSAASAPSPTGARVGAGRGRGGRDVAAGGRRPRAGHRARAVAGRWSGSALTARRQAAGARRRRVPAGVLGGRRAAAGDVDVDEPMSTGTVHALDPAGVAVTPFPWATACCVRGRRRTATGRAGRARVGRRPRVTQSPVPDASASGALLASASEPPPANSMVLRRPSDTNPPLDCTFHRDVCAPALDDTAVTRMAANTDRGDPNPTPHATPHPSPFRPHDGVATPLPSWLKRGTRPNLAPAAKKFAPWHARVRRRPGAAPAPSRPAIADRSRTVARMPASHVVLLLWRAGRRHLQRRGRRRQPDLLPDPARARLPALTANITNTIGIWPGYVASAAGFRREIGDQSRASSA